MIYYINLIFFYSLLGFILESNYFKYKNVNIHSSIFLGPYTFVYGFGMFFCLELKKVLGNLPNIFLNYLFYYLLFTITTTIVEFLGGHIIHYFLKIDKWNYSNKKYHFGKYITLTNSLIWGILATLMAFYFHPFFKNHILTTIPDYFTYIVCFIFFIDFILLVKKIIKNI